MTDANKSRSDAPDTAALALDRLRWEAENNFDGTCHTITQDTLELAAAALTDALAEVADNREFIATCNAKFAELIMRATAAEAHLEAARRRSTEAKIKISKLEQDRDEWRGLRNNEQARATAAEAKLAEAMDMLKRSQDDLADMDRECADTQAKLAEANDIILWCQRRLEPSLQPYVDKMLATLGARHER